MRDRLLLSGLFSALRAYDDTWFLVGLVLFVGEFHFLRAANFFFCYISQHAGLDFISSNSGGGLLC